MDKQDRYTARQERLLGEEIGKIYRRAGRKARALLDAFMKPYAAESERMADRVEAGEIPKAEYQAWLQREVFAGAAWDRTLREVATAFVGADTNARAAVGDTDRTVFREAANRTAREIGEHTKGAVSFDIYDEKTVDRLLQDDPQLLPEWKIDESKDYTWNEKRVNSVLTRGIVTGLSAPKIARELSGELATSNEKKMRMLARTAITGAENAGRVERMKETEAMGVTVLKKWLSVHDARTRDAHAELDGQTAKPDEPFKSALGNIMFPGDPAAHPANVYNCRCTLTYVYPDFD